MRYAILWEKNNNALTPTSLLEDYSLDILFYVILTFGLFGFMSFRHLDFRCNSFDLWTFHQKSFRPLDVSTQCHFELWVFRFYVISTFGLSDPMLFRPLSMSPKVISDFALLGFMSLRSSDFSILCYFDISTSHQKSFRPLFISY